MSDAKGTSTPESTAGAPGSITLGDRTFLVGAASHGDLMTVRRHLKKHVRGPLAMYGDLVSDPDFRRLPAKVRAELAKEAGLLKMQGQVALSAEMAADMLCEARHCRFLAWVLLRKSHPELTLEELAPLISDDTAPVVYADLARESGLAGLAGGDGDDAKN